MESLRVLVWTTAGCLAMLLSVLYILSIGYDYNVASVLWLAGWAVSSFWKSDFGKWGITAFVWLINVFDSFSVCSISRGMTFGCAESLSEFALISGFAVYGYFWLSDDYLFR